MKKRFLFCLTGLLCFLSYSSFAQFDRGDKLLNLGIGLNSYYSGGIPISTSFEVGITNEISIGVGLDYLNNNSSALGFQSDFSAFYFAGRGSYHFNELIGLGLKELDIYGGGSLGFRNFSWSNNNALAGLDNKYSSRLFVGVHAGARYYFAPHVGAFLEIGVGGSSNARTGIAFRF